MDILGENSRYTSVRVSFCFHLQAYACAYIEFSKTIDKLKILELNTKPRAGPFIIETGRTFSYIIFGPAGPLNWADQILCDTGSKSGAVKTKTMSLNAMLTSP